MLSRVQDLFLRVKIHPNTTAKKLDVGLSSLFLLHFLTKTKINIEKKKISELHKNMIQTGYEANFTKPEKQVALKLNLHTILSQHTFKNVVISGQQTIFLLSGTRHEHSSRNGSKLPQSTPPRHVPINISAQPF